MLRSRPALGLQQKYALMSSALILLVAVIMASALLIHFNQVLDRLASAHAGAMNEFARNQLENHALEYVHLVSEAVAEPFARGDGEAVAELLYNAKMHHSVRYAYLFDANGLILQGDHPLQPLPGGRRDAEGARAVASGRPTVEWGLATMAIVSPVLRDGQPLGGLRVGFSLRQLHQQLEEIGARIDALRHAGVRAEIAGVLAIKIILVLLGALLAVRMARHLTEPIRQLVETAKRIGGGKPQPMPFQRSDELGQLANALADMQTDLQQTTVSRRELGNIVDSLNDALIVTDPAGEIRQANRAAWEIFGYPPDELIGRSVRLLVEAPKACRELVDAPVGSVSAGSTLECLFRTRAGALLPVAVSISYIADSERDGRVFAVKDISERRRLEEELRVHRENLEQRVAERTRELSAVNRELETFSYSVSHDLRAPLRALNGFSQALMEDYGASLDSTAHDYLTRIRTATERMSQMIDGLLTLSRVTRRELQREKVDLSSIASDILNEMAAAESRRQTRFDVQPQLIAYADPTLMRVLLQNLLGNAWKFTAGRGETFVAFGRQPGRSDTFYVRDNGAGFDMAAADRLFLPFQRLHENGRYEGTGIGLATVARIVARHGGRVWAEAKPDQGATFYFTLGGSTTAGTASAEAGQGPG